MKFFNRKKKQDPATTKATGPRSGVQIAGPVLLLEQHEITDHLDQFREKLQGRARRIGP